MAAPVRPLRIVLAVALALVAWMAASTSAFAQTSLGQTDSDGDGVVNALDDNDDNDALLDVVDPFALDARNGLAQPLPLTLGWANPATDGAGGILGLGFTGLMANGVTDYLTQFDDAGVTAANGAVTVNAVDEGDAYYDFNSQRYAFQVGVPVRAGGAPVTVRTRIVAPFGGLTPQDFQSMGLFVGNGDQDNYLKLTTASIGEPSVQVLKEESRTTTTTRTVLAMPGPAYVDLFLRIDPTASTVQGSYVASVNGAETPQTAVSDPLPVPASWFSAPDRGLAVGIISTSFGPGPPFPATWDVLELTPETGAPPPAPVTPTGGDITAPTVRNLKVSPSRFATVRVRKKKAGATVRFTLSEPARVRLDVARRVPGRRVGGRCVARTSANAGSPSCTREVPVTGSVTANLQGGRQTVRLTGRIGGKRLAKGSYRLTVAATDAAGNSTMRRGPIFRVTR